MKIDILRIGNVTTTESVRFITENGSAVRNVNFIAHDKRVVFEPYQTMATAELIIVPQAFWHSAIEFAVHLDEPSDGATITSTHLHRSRCWIIHTGPFPSDEAHFGTRRDLLLGFLKTCWDNEGEHAHLQAPARAAAPGLLSPPSPLPPPPPPPLPSIVAVSDVQTNLGPP